LHELSGAVGYFQHALWAPHKHDICRRELNEADVMPRAFSAARLIKPLLEISD